MKKQILLLSMIASSGVFADIDWVDEHEPCYVDHQQNGNTEDIFDVHEDFSLYDTPFYNEEIELEDLGESDFILEESSLEEIVDGLDDASEEVVVTQILPQPSEELFVEVDFDLDDDSLETPEKAVETPKEEIIFVTRGYAHKEPIKEEMVFVTKGVAYKQPIKIHDEEIAYLDPKQDDNQIVDIAEVGPFTQFSIRGQSSKIALNNDAENKIVPEVEMIYFSSKVPAQEDFYLSSKKVTNREYESFIKATHHRPPPHWSKGEIPQGLEDAPVVNVTYKDAFLYSIWAGKRLPKESELIQAAKWDKDKCDIDPKMGEWTSTPSLGKNGTSRGAAHLTINSELSRITYHKVFLGDHTVESQVLDSHSYNNTTGFRVALNAKSSQIPPQ